MNFNQSGVPQAPNSENTVLSVAEPTLETQVSPPTVQQIETPVATELSQQQVPGAVNTETMVANTEIVTPVAPEQVNLNPGADILSQTAVEAPIVDKTKQDQANSLINKEPVTLGDLASFAAEVDSLSE